MRRPCHTSLVRIVLPAVRPLKRPFPDPFRVFAVNKSRGTRSLWHESPEDWGAFSRGMPPIEFGVIDPA